MLRPIISLFLLELIGKGDLSKLSSIIAESRIIAKNEANSSIIAESMIVAGNEDISPKTAESRIVAGQVSIPYSVPYAVYIVKRKTTVPGKQMCTGSLISRNWVVTAKHCANDLKEQQLYLGTHNNRIPEPTQQIFEMIIDDTHIIQHDKFDIALLKLPKPAELNRFINIVKLPSFADEENNYDYMVGRASGWGRNSDDKATSAPARMRTIRVMTLPNKECIDKWYMKIQKEEMCTQGAFGKGTCSGDSGGPFVINDVLIGVTSRGPKKCQAGQPSIWIRVPSFLSWIKEKTDAVVN